MNTDGKKLNFWLPQSGFELVKCQNIYSSTQNPVVLSNLSAVSHRFCCQVEHYYLVHFTGSWLVKLLWFLTNSQNLIWETSWGTLLFFFTYGIHGNFPRQIHFGKISHTKSCHPMGNSHLPMGKTASVIPPVISVQHVMSTGCSASFWLTVTKIGVCYFCIMYPEFISWRICFLCLFGKA